MSVSNPLENNFCYHETNLDLIQIEGNGWLASLRAYNTSPVSMGMKLKLDNTFSGPNTDLVASLYTI